MRPKLKINFKATKLPKRKKGGGGLETQLFNVMGLSNHVPDQDVNYVIMIVSLPCQQLSIKQYILALQRKSMHQ